VMAGGALGAAARFHLGRATLQLAGPGWPWGTLTANVVGGLLMGLLAGLLARHGSGAGWGGENWRLLIGVGLLGGFTTFSAFTLESANMMLRGDLAPAFAYVAASVIGAIAALFAGLMLARGIA